MNEKSDTEKLTGVPETLLVALYLRAVETQRADGIIRDEKAVEMIQSIEYDFSRFNRVWLSQVGVAVRTEILDEVTAAFMRQYPDASVVNLGAGLCTRFNRVDNGSITWYELDLPEIIELRRRFFTETGRHQFIERSRTDGQAEFKWGSASGAVCETWDGRIRFVREWNYLDRHRGRWRFMRLFAYIPPLKRHMMNKIVHLRFRKEG